MTMRESLEAIIVDFDRQQSQGYGTPPCETLVAVYQAHALCRIADALEKQQDALERLRFDSLPSESELEGIQATIRIAAALEQIVEHAHDAILVAAGVLVEPGLDVGLQAVGGLDGELLGLGLGHR